ncbi:MAG: hypothetical protein A3G20_01305 [Acidobacteria bacterium RIFCSPLOWO2_12_FULL_59_11]|nr:MAG: hypothetical protein A3G20_01305 [Acidobacteria bacterium RIFCSPLOWO2_12_FULL_59_11]
MHPAKNKTIPPNAKAALLLRKLRISPPFPCCLRYKSFTGPFGGLVSEKMLEIPTSWYYMNTAIIVESLCEHR